MEASYWGRNEKSNLPGPHQNPQPITSAKNNNIKKKKKKKKRRRDKIKNSILAVGPRHFTSGARRSRVQSVYSN